MFAGGKKKNIFRAFNRGNGNKDASIARDSTFYRIAEVYFPSKAALDACAASPGGEEALAHAVEISSGGSPLFLSAEEETYMFTQIAGA
jgi:hypothetical protein